jgi:integrase
MSVRFSRLTRPAIRRLKPGEKITEHGITAECLENSDARYTVNFMVDGQRIHRVIGRESDGVTRTQCEEFIETKRTEAREGRLSLPEGRKLRLIFGAAAEIYLKRQRETCGKNLIAKEQHLRLHLTPYFGPIRLDRISPFTLDKFTRRLEESGLTTGTRNRIAVTYNHMARRLLEWRVISSPLPTFRKEPEHNRREYVLTLEEEAQLLDAALHDGHPYAWLFVRFGLSTSMRHREILTARFEHFDPVRRRIRVRVKGGRWHKQPLTQELGEVITKEQEMANDPSGWIFPSKVAQSGHTESMTKPFRRCVIAAGLDPRKVTPHTMRHTAITRLAGIGADIATVQTFSGHQSVQMVMRYTHAQEGKVDAALERMEKERTLHERPNLTRLPKS